MNDQPNLFDAPGTLTVDVGEGVLSAYEATRLEAGDIVTCDAIAGDPVILRFNGVFLAQGEIVILGDLFGVRLYSLDRPIPRGAPTSRMEDILELLPTAIRIGCVEATLGELGGAVPGTIISLGIPFSSETDATLMIGGIPAARGKVAAYFESMAIRLAESVTSASDGDRAVRSTGYHLRRDLMPEKLKDYDFRRPDKFSSVTIRKFADVHGLFHRNLSEQVRGFNGFSLSAVDQMTFGELAERVDESGVVHAVMRVASWPPGNSQLHPYAGTLIEPRSAGNRVSDESRAMVAKIAQGGDRLERKAVFLSTPSRSAIATAIDEDPDVVAGSLRAAWRSHVDLNLHLDSAPAGFDTIDLIHEREMVITARFEQGTDWFELAYPYLTLDPIMDVLR